MGVGGIGVSALAEMALAEGAIVSGCDREESSVTRDLCKKGIQVSIGHDPSHVAGQDLLIYSSAIPETHPERLSAGEKQEKRGAFLARLMSKHCGVGVSGTHGKTTTSWFLSHLLIQSGEDPFVFIGGMVPALKSGNYRLGEGRFIAELDESDESFLLPKLNVAIATNLESDHMSHYQDFDALKRAFGRYADGVAENGLFIAGVDCKELAEIFDHHQGRKLSFGLCDNADVQATDIVANGTESIFDLNYHGNDLGRFTLPLPGRHNILNALAALGAALELGAGVDNLHLALPSLCGVGRRLELIGSINGTQVYSDYAHHPTEVAATIEAMRQAVSGPLLVAFQPHLYSRTRDYCDEFAAALSAADAVVLTDIYPAREEPIPGVTADLIAEPAKKTNPHVTGPISLADSASVIRNMAGDFEAIIMMGAGCIDKVAREMVG